MMSPPSSPVEKSAHIPTRRPEITILNEPKWRSSRRGFSATYSLPTRLPVGSHRVRRIGSTGSAAQLTASKSTFFVLHEEREFRAFEVAFLTPCRAPPRPGYFLVSSMCSDNLRAVDRVAELRASRCALAARRKLR